MSKRIKTDVLIIGSGIAGSAAALELAKKSLKVLIINKEKDFRESNTFHAQGGIIAKGIDDSPELLAEDIKKAGDELCEEGAVKILAEQGPRLVEKILIRELKVPFWKENGKLDFTQEAAHSRRRILHSDDLTGKAIEEKIIQKLKLFSNITLLSNHTAIDLLTIPHHSKNPLDVYKDITSIGAYVLDNQSREIKTIFAKKTILATGGLGQIFLHTTNPKCARGDGLALAFRAGAKILNAEYIQFHPTAFYHQDADRFLISESLRGEGAKLKTKDGKLFMKKYDNREDLAPRDIVARAIYNEMMERKEDYVLLDLASYMKAVKIKKRFPFIYQTCLSFGLDISQEPIPVVPAAHYFCGGVKVDENGKTDIKNLYAIGEVSCTGLHGANRLASTSLLEGLVWGKRSAEDIITNFFQLRNVNYPRKSASLSAYFRGTSKRIYADDNAEKRGKYNFVIQDNLHEWPFEFSDIPDWQDKGLIEEVDPALISQDWITIKSIMWNYVGLIRSKKKLERAKADLEYLNHRIDQFYRETKVNDDLIGLRNGIESALIITQAALVNKKSRGCHFIASKFQ